MCPFVCIVLGLHLHVEELAAAPLVERCSFLLVRTRVMLALLSTELSMELVQKLEPADRWVTWVLRHTVLAPRVALCSLAHSNRSHLRGPRDVLDVVVLSMVEAVVPYDDLSRWADRSAVM